MSASGRLYAVVVDTASCRRSSGCDKAEAAAQAADAAATKAHEIDCLVEFAHGSVRNLGSAARNLSRVSETLGNCMINSAGRIRALY
jgi:hypothetical protein